jgi:hypothetical protein
MSMVCWSASARFADLGLPQSFGQIWRDVQTQTPPPRLNLATRRWDNAL